MCGGVDGVARPWLSTHNCDVSGNAPQPNWPPTHVLASRMLPLVCRLTDERGLGANPIALWQI